MKKYFSLALLLFTFLPLSAQTESENTFTRSHFTFNLQNGITRGKAEMHSGLLRPDPRTGHIFHGNLNYTFNFSKKFGLTAGAGLGSFPIAFELYQLELGRSQYFDAAMYTSFASVRSEFNYRHKISPKYLLNGYSGISGITTYSSQVGTGGFSSTQPEALYEMLFKYDKGWKPIIHLGTGVSRILSNQDLLTFRIDYNYSFKDMYNGTYRIMPNTPDDSKGRYYNTGNHLNLGIGYTFTREEKKEKINSYLKENLAGDAKRKYRFEKRRIPENTTFIGFSGGITAPINKPDDPNKVLLTATLLNLMPYIYAEHNVKNSYFAEVGFAFQEYFSATKVKNSYGTSGSNAFNAFQLNLGGGKRLTGKNNNYNYLNLQAEFP
jgi:hypothetical protein